MGSIPLRIMFDEINGVMKIYDRNSWYDKICDRIKYLVSNTN